MQTSRSQTAPEGSPFARHLPPLDGIRGLAILGVVGSHLFQGNAHTAFQLAAQHSLAFGANGVDLFFVLSGFLITGILYDSLPDPAFFRKFYARRILRIFPLYYAVLVVFALAALPFGLYFFRELLSLALYLQNSNLIATPIRYYVGPPALPLTHFWSLAIEEQFYLVWPVTVFFLRNKRSLLVFCAASLCFCPLLRFALLTHGVNFFTVHTNTLCRSDSLLAGGALALLLRSHLHDRVLRARGWIFMASVLAYGVVPLLFWLGLISIPSIGFNLVLALTPSAIAFGSVGLIALALQSGQIGEFFSIKPMRWLGKYSYGIYVLHLILIAYLEEPIRLMVKSHLTLNKEAGVVIGSILIFFMSLAAAYLSYNLYEKRFLRLKRFFDYRHHSNTVN